MNRKPKPLTNHDSLKKCIGGIIAAERLSRNLSQRELASQANMHSVMISSYETGRRLPDIQNLMALADVFGVSVDYLLGRSDE